MFWAEETGGCEEDEGADERGMVRGKSGRYATA